MRLSRVIFAVIAALVILITPRNAYAIAYDLIPPSGTLQRGQVVQFIIDIDTQGSNVTTASVGMTYDTQYLQYKSATQGDALTTLSVTQPATGQLLLSGTNSGGFNGTGTFAYVTFTLIATAPGSTELCVLTVPDVTPTPLPTTPPVNPTQLPKTGSVISGYRSAALGGILLASSVGLYLWYSRNRYESKSRARKKHA